MSDHPKEAERNLKRIRICNDIYLDVFRLLSPEKVGLELALVSDRFDAMVDTHFEYRKWTLGKLRIWSKEIIKKNDDGSEKTFPFPQEPLPNSIIGFSSVRICVFDSDAFAFLQCIGRLFVSNVYLDLVMDEVSDWNTFATSVWPLLIMSGIIKIYFGISSDFPNFRRLISPSILRDCSNLQMITFGCANGLKFPPNDANGSPDGQALCKWLHTPRADGQPKVLECVDFAEDFPMEALKTTFLNATTSVSFIIIIHLYSTSVGPFELVNSLTREQLSSQRIKYGDWLIKRSPIDKSAQKWAEWEKVAMELWANDWKMIRMPLWPGFGLINN